MEILNLGVKKVHKFVANCGRVCMYGKGIWGFNSIMQCRKQSVSVSFSGFNNRGVVSRFSMMNSFFIVLYMAEIHVLVNSKSCFPGETF